MSYIPETLPEPNHNYYQKPSNFTVRATRIFVSSICGVFIGSLLEAYVFRNYEAGLIFSSIISGAIWEFLRGLNKTS